MRIFYFFILFFSFLHGIEIDKKTTYQEILSRSSYYVDYNRTVTIETIATKKFTPINDKELGFGYSPDFVVWIKFVIKNSSNKNITKIIEYANPLTSYVDFYDTKSKKLLKSSGMLNKNPKDSINPTLKVTLQPHESRTFYIKVFSYITSLNPKLNLWNIKAYNRKLKQDQIVLALFFGAMGVIALYNFMIFIITRKVAFLYYFIAFLGIIIYYMLYKGVASLLFPKEMVEVLNSLIPFIVLIPVIFLSLFTKRALALHENRRVDKFFKAILTVTIISTFIFYVLGMHSIRNLSFVILFFVLFGLTIYYLKKSSYAKYLLISWFVFTLTALFMYLENIEVFNTSTIFPYYSEVALLFETLSFSLILAHYMARLERTKKEYQQEVEYKVLVINELDHRISGFLQSIMYNIHQEESQKRVELNSLKQNILAIGEINRLLNTTQSFPKVNMQEYLTKLINRLQEIYDQPNIKIFVDIDETVELKPKSATSCAKILHEAVTNIYKYAFSNSCGDASVSLRKESNLYTFIIADSGDGIQHQREGAKGLLLIEDMVKNELEGTVDIDSFNGVKITIRWQEDEQNNISH